jgi:DNA end-binding protein Ku
MLYGAPSGDFLPTEREDRMASKARPASLFPRASRSFVLSFGLVNVSVAIAPVMGDSKISANRVCPEHHGRVKQAWFCEAGEHYVPLADLVSAYEYGGKSVPMDAEDLKALEALSDGTVKLTACVEASTIDPAYVEKSYLIWPQGGAEQAYDLLYHALREDDRALVGTCVLTKSTRTLVVRYSEEFGTLVAHICHYGANVKTSDVEKVQTYAAGRETPNAETMALVRQVLDSLAPEFDPNAVEDSYNVSLLDAIANKAVGGSIGKPVDTEATPTDLLAALRAQVNAMQSEVTA